MKRILVMLMSVILISTLTITSSVAYLTDEESKENVMTVGKVDIELIEQQRVEDTAGQKDASDLEAFDQNKNMMPIVDDNKDPNNLNMSDDSNYIDKIVRVKNTGDSPAWVRLFVAIPAALENIGGVPEDDALHWDSGAGFAEARITTDTGDGITTAVDSYNVSYDYENYFDQGGWKLVGAAMIAPKSSTGAEGTSIEYNVYCLTGQYPLEKEKTTPAAMVGAYLDSLVDYNDEAANPDYPYYFRDKANVINYNLDNDIYIPVFAQAIQAEGFESAAAAFAAQDANLPDNPWATASSFSANPPANSLANNPASNPAGSVPENSNPVNGTPEEVTPEKALLAALDAGTATLDGPVTLTNGYTVSADQDIAIDLNGHTLTISDLPLIVKGTLVFMGTEAGSSVSSTTGNIIRVLEGGQLVLHGGAYSTDNPDTSLIYGDYEVTATATIEGDAVNPAT